MQSGRKAVNGHLRKRGARFALGLVLLAGGQAGAIAAAGGLESARQFAAVGASELALHLLETGQPAVHEDPDAWEAWERERVALLRDRQSWETLVERLAAVPEGAPPAFRHWADVNRAEAMLLAGDPAEARALAARLIWAGADPETHQALRRLVIRAYLAEGRTRDAYGAMLRFRHDYGAGSRDETLLRARVLLANDLPQDAARELAAVTGDPEAEALALLARLRGERTARRVLEGGERLLAAPDLPPPLRRFVTAVIAEAAQQVGDVPRAILAWEYVIGRPAEGDAATDELFPAAGDRLWSAYLDYAMRVANREQLLIGDDDAWLALAATDSHRFPVRSRALHAAVALQGADPVRAQAAHTVLMDAVLALSGGPEVLHALYVRSGRFAKPSDLPAVVRYHLADEAVARSELKRAAQLLDGMVEPPGEADAVAWQLRRARILVLGGEPARGAAILNDLAGEAASFPPALRDRLVQVVFDLQAVEQHDAACEVLERLLLAIDAPAVRRELQFWMGDSRAAQKRHAEAAQLYLESALALGPAVLDPWAQTARYQAAKSLADAGLLSDARTLLSSLLGVTEDPQRRAVLQHEIERLEQRKRREHSS